MKILFLFLLIGCAKSPCLVFVDVTLKDQGASATAKKIVKCGEGITFPFNVINTGKRPAEIRFIEIHFFQGARVVRGDIVYQFDFVDSVFSRLYEFPDTNPDLMIWRVYSIDRTSKEYQTVIK